MARRKAPELDWEGINASLRAGARLDRLMRPWRILQRLTPKHILPLPKSYWLAIAVKNALRSPKRLKVEDKIRFLRETEAAARKAVPEMGFGQKSGKRRRGGDFRLLLKRAESDPVMLQKWVMGTVEAIEEREIGRLRETVTKYVRSLVERKGKKIDTGFERQVLDRTVSYILQNMGVGRDPARRISPIRIRMMYLGMKMRMRLEENQKKAAVKQFFGEIFGEENFTRNQERAAIRWLEQNYESLEAGKERLKKSFLPEGEKAASKDRIERLSKEFYRMTEAFKKRARREVLKMFRAERRAVETAGTERVAATKGGRRAERMAAHAVAVEKKGEVRKDEGKKERPREKRVAKAFSTAEFVLGEIEKGSKKSATFLRGLHEKGLISEASLTKLYSSGGLTLRLFQKAANDSAFRRAFGPEQIEVLAKGIGYIGSSGRQPTTLRKAFEGPRGNAVFDFLKRKGYFETWHGAGRGRGVIYYLRRL